MLISIQLCLICIWYLHLVNCMEEEWRDQQEDEELEIDNIYIIIIIILYRVCAYFILCNIIIHVPLCLICKWFPHLAVLVNCMEEEWGDQRDS